MLDGAEQVVPLEGAEVREAERVLRGRELTVRPIPAGLAAAWTPISREAVCAAPAESLKAALDRSARGTTRRSTTGRPAARRRGAVVRDPRPTSAPACPLTSRPTSCAYGSTARALDDIRDDETWVDVDVGQQTLAVMRGQQPIFVTLVSSGTGHKPNTATPRGVYRIRNKLAYGPMRNRAEDAEDSPYHVEAVPWVQYFFRRFALHARTGTTASATARATAASTCRPATPATCSERTGPSCRPAG